MTFKEMRERLLNKDKIREQQEREERELDERERVEKERKRKAEREERKAAEKAKKKEEPESMKIKEFVIEEGTPQKKVPSLTVEHRASVRIYKCLTTIL